MLRTRNCKESNPSQPGRNLIMRGGIMDDVAAWQGVLNLSRFSGDDREITCPNAQGQRASLRASANEPAWRSCEPEPVPDRVAVGDRKHLRSLEPRLSERALKRARIEE